MATKITIRWEDGFHDDLDVTVRDDITIREWRAAMNSEELGTLQDLILDSIETVEGYESVDDMNTRTLNEVVQAVGKFLRGESQTQSDGATRSQRRAAARKKKNLRG